MPTLFFGDQEGRFYRVAVLGFMALPIVGMIVGLIVKTDPKADDESEAKKRGGRVWNFIALGLFPFLGQFFNAAGVVAIASNRNRSDGGDIILALTPFMFLLPLLFVGTRKLLRGIKRKSVAMPETDDNIQQNDDREGEDPLGVMNGEGNNDSNNNRTQSQQQLAYHVVPYHLVLSFVVKKQNSKSKFLAPNGPASAGIRFLKSPLGRFCIIGSYCWVRDSFAEDEDEDQVSLLLSMPRLFARVRGPTKIEKQIIDSNSTKHSELVDAESIPLRTSPFFIIISATCCMISNFLQGLSKGSDNEAVLCRAALGVNLFVSIFMLLLSICLRPMIVPLHNHLFIMIEACGCFAAIMSLYLTEIAPELLIEKSDVVAAVQIVVITIGCVAGGISLITKWIRLYLLNVKGFELVSEHEFWRRKTGRFDLLTATEREIGEEELQQILQQQSRDEEEQFQEQDDDEIMQMMDQSSADRPSKIWTEDEMATL